ncbi:MAG: hypothetical protein KDA91_02355 [Planctomycetaceae bacterium]|nr:hypothetical protein [Planctomycetaceae bacterium]
MKSASTVRLGTSSEDIVKNAFRGRHAQTDRVFMYLLPLQGFALILMAVLLTPYTWNGTESSIHVHVWVSATLGMLITAFPAFLAWLRPGEQSTRLIIGVAQTMITAVLIHVGGGRIEMHFHAFVSLAILAAYLDVGVIVAATLTLALDHLVRGIYFPQSVFGIAEVQLLRILEHVLWVVFEDVILILTIVQSRSKYKSLYQTFAAINRCVRAMDIDPDYAQFAIQSGAEGLLSHEAVEKGLLLIRNGMLRVQHSVSDIDSQTGVLSQTASSAVDVVETGTERAEISREVMRRLNSSVEEISASIAEINTIAEQTRLLALNATIEAARSNSSAGAGFAVVARQVKELSVKASVAASRITRTARLCEERVGESLETTDDIARQLDEVKAIVRSTDETICRIREETSSSSMRMARMVRAFDVGADIDLGAPNHDHALRRPPGQAEFGEMMS